VAKRNASTALLSTIEVERREYIRCRTIGHAWFDTDSTWKPQFGVPLTVRCERCGMERRVAVQWRTGEMLGKYRYVRPKDYLYTKDQPAPTRDEFRRLLLALRGELEG